VASSALAVPQQDAVTHNAGGQYLQIQSLSLQQMYLTVSPEEKNISDHQAVRAVAVEDNTI
jgi:hypothetical protein